MVPGKTLGDDGPNTASKDFTIIEQLFISTRESNENPCQKSTL